MIEFVHDAFASVMELWTQSGFRWGLVIGMVLALVLLGLGLMTGRPVLGWGLSLGIAGWVLVGSRFSLPDGVFLAVALLVGGGLMVDLRARRRVVRPMAPEVLISTVVVLLAAFMITRQVDVDPVVGYAFPLVVLATAAAIAAVGSSKDADLLGPLLFLTMAGIWVTVPETDMVVVVVGLSLSLGLATLRPVRGRTLVSGAASIAGLFALLTLLGGEVRTSSIVTGWVSIGLIPLIPFLDPGLFGKRRPAVLLGAHFVMIALLTRMADWGANGLVVALTYAVVAALVLGLVRPSRSESLGAGA